MRTSDSVKGGRPSASHDELCRYLNDRAAAFLQDVAPSEGGYQHVRAELERPFVVGDRIGGFVDLMITGVATSTIQRWQRDIGHLYSVAADTLPVTACFVEVKRLPDPLGVILRQFEQYRFLWGREQVPRFELDPCTGDIVSAPALWCSAVVWVLVTAYQPTPGELGEYARRGIVVKVLENIDQRMAIFRARHG